MVIKITLIDGKKIKAQINDQNMNAFLGRLRGPDTWIDLNGDNKKYLNCDAVLIIEDATPPEAPE